MARSPDLAMFCDRFTTGASQPEFWVRSQAAWATNSKRGYVMKSVFRVHRRSPVARHRRLCVERLEDRSLLALVGYQLHLLPPGGAVNGGDLTTVKVGDFYDLAVTVQDLTPDPGPNAGVLLAYLDIHYDSSKSRVQTTEIQEIDISGQPDGGSFSLMFDGQKTADIPFNADPAVLAANVQTALDGLSKIGPGNVAVSRDSYGLTVAFGGKFLCQDAPNMTVASQNLSGANNPTVSVSYWGDLNDVNGAANAFQEAFRLPPAESRYQVFFSAIDAPNLLDEVGAADSLFGIGAPAGTAPLELVRARMRATGAGTITFTPDVSNMRPGHETYVAEAPSPIAPADIDVGPAKTLTILAAHPFHNAAVPEDCSGDGFIAPNDALQVINYINSYGSGPVPNQPVQGFGYLDVTDDGFIVPADALVVINYINSHPNRGNGEGEGALAAAATAGSLPNALAPAADDESQLSDLIAQLATDAAENAERRRLRPA